MDLYIYDVSEWQDINWPAYPSEAVIVRLNYGAFYPDKKLALNVAGARSRCKVRGWYTYLVAGQAPEPQADLLANILAARGGLQAGEFVVCDDEEGAGDQAPRVEAFLNRVHSRFQESAGQDWAYSGQYFARAHLGGLPSGVHRWIAAYGGGEPSDHHDLWQFTSSASVAGIAGKVDCSVFHGTIDQLAALIGGDMWSDDEKNRALGQLAQIFNFLKYGSDGTVGRSRLDLLGAEIWNFHAYGMAEQGGQADLVTTKVAALEQKVAQLSAPTVDVQALAPLLSTALTPLLVAALAPHVSDPEAISKVVLTNLGKALSAA